MTSRTYIALSSPAQHMDLIVTSEEVVESEVAPNEEFLPLTGTTPTPLESKILLTISEDLCYTLTITGDTLAALFASIAADDQLKSEWHLWQRFVTNPNQFFVYIFDEDFKEYVRYRDSYRIRHLSRIKIKNRFYVNPGLSQTSAIDVLDTEPTDTLIGDQVDSCSAPLVQTSADKLLNVNNNIDLNQTYPINTSHHNYSQIISASPSAPLSTGNGISTSNSTATTTTAIHSSINSYHTLSHEKESKLTKATKKLFKTPVPTEKSPKEQHLLDINTREEGSDLLAEAPTGPSFEWTQEQTVTFLEFSRNFAKELAPKKNVLEVRPGVWEQLAKEMNTKAFGHFDALLCRNHFSRLRSTYTNILCYPALVSETRWPYFDLMKQIVGDKPLEIERRVSTRQQAAKLKLNAKRLAAKRQHRKASGSIMKNSANQEVSEVYVALLNLVKKYMKYFETEKKNQIWTRIEKEMNSAGYKWNAISLRGLFHRLRYNYLNILRSVGDEELANASWPYFRYFQGLDLTAFRTRKVEDMNKKSLKAIVNAPKIGTEAKRQRGRPRKQNPNLNDQYSTTEATNGLATDEMSANNSLEVQFYEFSDDESTGSDVEGVENKKKVKSE